MLDFSTTNHVSNKPEVLIPYIKGFNKGASDDTRCDQIRFRVDRGTLEGVSKLVLIDSEDWYWIDVADMAGLLRSFAGLDVSKLRDLEIVYHAFITDDATLSDDITTHEEYIMEVKFKLD